MKSITKFEIFKLIKNKFFLGIIFVSLITLAGIFFVNFHYSQLSLTELHNREKDQVDMYYKNYKKYEGEFDENKVTLILKDFMDEYQNSNIEKRPLNLFSWNIAETFFNNEQDVYTQMNKAIENNKPLHLNDVAVKNIKDLHFSQFEEKLKIGNYVTWNDYINVINAIFSLTIFISILIGSLSFANDDSKNITPLLLSTKLGRNKLTHSKIISATLLSLGLAIILQLLGFVGFLFYNHGLDGWDASIQTNFYIKVFDFPLNINQLQSVLLILFLQFFSLIFTIIFSIYISSKTKNPFTSLVISVGFYFIPLGLTKIFREGIINKFLYIFPVNNYEGQNMLSTLSGNLISSSFLLNYFFIIVFMTFTSLLVYIIIYTSRKNIIF